MKCPAENCKQEGFYEDGWSDYCESHVPLTYFEPERPTWESLIVLGRDLESK